MFDKVHRHEDLQVLMPMQLQISVLSWHTA